MLVRGGFKLRFRGIFDRFIRGLRNEVVGLFMKHIVLAIRLFANMFAGHLVLAVLLAFIGVTFESGLVYLVAPGAVGVSVAVNMLEIFVAFLQAYIFTFLSALFIGFAAHPH